MKLWPPAPDWVTRPRNSTVVVPGSPSDTAWPPVAASAAAGAPASPDPEEVVGKVVVVHDRARRGTHRRQPAGGGHGPLRVGGGGAGLQVVGDLPDGPQLAEAAQDIHRQLEPGPDLHVGDDLRGGERV